MTDQELEDQYYQERIKDSGVPVRPGEESIITNEWSGSNFLCQVVHRSWGKAIPYLIRHMNTHNKKASSKSTFGEIYSMSSTREIKAWAQNGVLCFVEHPHVEPKDQTVYLKVD